MSNGSGHNERSEVAIPNSPYVERSREISKKALHYDRDNGCGLVGIRVVGKSGFLVATSNGIVTVSVAN